MLDNYYTETGGDRASERLLPDTIRRLGLENVVNTSGLIETWQVTAIYNRMVEANYE